ncbi:MAG: MBL fold metallo-hydrolase [Gemmatimonadota bacterium]|nr:MBL fold metallo-hydrolase [Gemmatimonadota bacterium]
MPVTSTLTVWGSRGSIPTPGPQTARYGGNTSCISIELSEAAGSRLLVLDAGSGIRVLGNVLMGRDESPLQMDVLLTHTHWDHIQGFPFFSPVFAEGNIVRVWGARQGEVDLEVILQQQMHPVVFPVPLHRSAADLAVEHVQPGRFDVDGFVVDAIRLRHPGNTLGYRLTPVHGGATVAYIMDNELGPGGDYEVGAGWRSQLTDFIGGVDLLIHDAMYTPDDIERHRGWGHSCYSEAVTLAAQAQVGRLMLFHHRPERADDAMDHLLAAARSHAEQSGHHFEVIAAAEGMQLTL